VRNLFAFFACLILLSCREDVTETTTEEVAPIAVSMPADKSYGVANEAISEAAAPLPAAEPVDEQKIIRDATLRFQTSDMDKTYRQIVVASKKLGGQIQTDSETNEYGRVSRSLAIRIPNQKFDAFLTDAGKDVAYFDQKEISSSDVTEEYIDTDARLNAKKKLEARYLQLLTKATKVSEMIEIEQQLANVREEIEAKEGRLRYMNNRIAQSTVNITFYKLVPTEGGAKVSYGARLGNALSTGFNSILLFFVELLNNWPLILILVVLIFWLRKKLRKRKNP